jgi:single-strand DNA-binding protein
MDLLSTTASGRLTGDPTLRYTNGGQAVCDLDIASNRRWRDRNGEWQEETTYIAVTAFGPLAENVAESLSKGNRVIVTGRLTIEKWERDGQPRSKAVIVANDVAASMSYASVAVTPNPKGDGNVTPTPAPAPPTAAPDDDGRPF